LADELKDQVNGLLLLTATPMQVHPFELYSLIELVEPGMFPTFKGYERLRGNLPRLNALMKALKGWKAMSAADRAAVVRAEAKLLAEIGVSADDAIGGIDKDDEREQLMDRLAERHP